VLAKTGWYVSPLVECSYLGYCSHEMIPLVRHPSLPSTTVTSVDEGPYEYLRWSAEKTPVELPVAELPSLLRLSRSGCRVCIRHSRHMARGTCYFGVEWTGSCLEVDAKGRERLGCSAERGSCV